MDEEATLYDMEMQTVEDPQLPKRMRYYADVIDLTDLQAGADYDELKEIYIIFICLKDPFKLNLPIYEFRMRCVQDVTVPFENGVHNVVVNASCNKKDVSLKLRNFFLFLKTGKGNDGLTKRLEKAVSEAILRDDWKVEYMQFELMLKRERKEGREQGREEGRIQDIAIALQKEDGEKFAREFLNATDEEIEKAKHLVNGTF